MRAKEKKELIKLKELLALVKSINVSKWNIICRIAKDIDNGIIEIISSHWCDSFKQSHPEYYPLKLNDINTWSTYDKCHNLFFSIEDDKLYCDAVIFDGDNMNGYPTHQRFAAKLLLPYSYLFSISPYIEHKFERYLENEYDSFLEKQKQIWIEAEKTKILKTFGYE